MQVITHDNGCAMLVSELFASRGIVHGFTTRIGGVSRPPFNSLNVGQPLAEPFDTPEDMAQNIRIAKAALGCAAAQLVAVRQVHGCAVHAVSAADVQQARRLAVNGGAQVTRDPMLQDRPIEADALLCGLPGVVIGVRMADCVPILLATGDGRHVAAVHAGWRGLVAKVLPMALQAMCERAGVSPREVVAAVGPCIGVGAFEVGPEVAEAFEAIGLGTCVDRGFGAKPHIDLAEAAASQLRSAGVQQVDEAKLCTSEREDLFFSHRRDHGRTGRMAALIATKA